MCRQVAHWISGSSPTLSIILHHRDLVSVVADIVIVTIVTIVTILCVSVSGGRNRTKNKIFIRKI